MHYTTPLLLSYERGYMTASAVCLGFCQSNFTNAANFCNEGDNGKVLAIRYAPPYVSSVDAQMHTEYPDAEDRFMRIIGNKGVSSSINTDMSAVYTSSMQFIAETFPNQVTLFNNHKEGVEVRMDNAPAHLTQWLFKICRMGHVWYIHDIFNKFMGLLDNPADRLVALIMSQYGVGHWGRIDSGHGPCNTLTNGPLASVDTIANTMNAVFRGIGEKRKLPKEWRNTVSENNHFIGNMNDNLSFRKSVPVKDEIHRKIIGMPHDDLVKWLSDEIKSGLAQAVYESIGVSYDDIRSSFMEQAK